MTSPWRFQMLGGFVGRRGDAVLQRYRSQQHRALLAYLVLHAGRSQRREHLIDLFWPESDVDAGRASLRTALSALRRQLEGPGLAPGGSVLITEGNSAVYLAADAVESDVAAFEGAIRRAASAAARGDHEQERTEYERALAAWGGPFLPGFFHEWALAEQARLGEAHLRALLRSCEICRRAGRYDEALALARRAVSADPLYEEAAAAAIVVLREMGQEAEARRQYQALERALADSLGVEPSPPVRALLTAEPPTRVARVAAPHSVPAVAAAADAPMAPTAPSSGSAPAGEGASVPPPPPVRLPRPLTRFFGREQEIDRVCALLTATDAPCRLLTVTGPGGAGKTRLVVEAARRLGEGDDAAFPGGVAFVPLADLRDAARIPEAGADALEAPRPPGASSAFERIDALLKACAAESGAAAPPRVLLVLDNAEHLLPEAADAIRDLLEKLPDLTCLVTSRHLLMLSGEQEMPLEPLPVPPPPGAAVGGSAPQQAAGEGEAGAEPDIPALLALPAVRLFLDRAQATRPDFALNVRNADAVAELCRILEGIPLAIELAAAWTQLLPPARILERIAEGKRLDLLVARRRDIPVRHATLRAAIASSHDLLPERARSLFARLSVFRGGWTLEDAEAVCGAEDPLAFLDSITLLREHSLVAAREGADGTLRFTMLETLREFAAEKLAASDPGGETERRYVEHFLSVAEGARPELVGPEPMAALERLVAEQENLRAALDRALGLGGVSSATLDPADALRFAEALGPFWQTRGALEEGRRYLMAALERAGDAAPEALRARALTARAGLGVVMFAYEEAERDLAAAAELYRRAGDEVGVGGALKDMARTAIGRNDYDRAEALLAEARGPLERSGDREALGTLYNTLGMLRLERNEKAEAATYFWRALELLEGVGQLRQVAAVRTNLGTALAEIGDPEGARQQQQRAADDLERAGDGWSHARVLDSLGETLRRLGRDDEARAVLERALAVRRRIHDWLGAINSYHFLSLLTMETEPETAERYLRESIRIVRTTPRPRFIGFILQSCGDFAAVRGDAERAIRLWAAAAARFRSMGVATDGPLTDHQARYQDAVYAAVSPEVRAAAEAAGRAMDDAAATSDDLLGEESPRGASQREA